MEGIGQVIAGAAYLAVICFVGWLALITVGAVYYGAKGLFEEWKRGRKR